KWQLQAILDDAQAMCSHYGQRALLPQEGHLNALREQVDAITTAELRSVAREVLTRSRLHAVAVGTFSRKQRSEIKRALSVLGPARARAASPKRRAHART